MVSLITQTRNKLIIWGMGKINPEVGPFFFWKIPQTIINDLYFTAFEVNNGENRGNALKINDYRKTISFCKFLRDESSDFPEILYGGQ